MSLSKFLDEAPQKKSLKEYFIDSNRSIFPPDTLNCVAHLILYLETPDEVMNIGLDYLVNKFAADRANGGFIASGDKLYKSTSIRYGNSENQSPNVFVFSNKLSVFQKVWKQHKPVVCDSVDSSTLLIDSRDQFKSIKSQSMLMQRLSFEGKAVGLTCIDFVNREHEWKIDEIVFMELFCETFFGPLLGISKHWYSHNKFQAIKKPSVCELTVIRLAAKGLGYKQISRNLGKSVRTIENQIRNARMNLGASNLPELINKCEIWL